MTTSPAHAQQRIHSKRAVYFGVWFGGKPLRGSTLLLWTLGDDDSLIVSGPAAAGGVPGRRGHAGVCKHRRRPTPSAPARAAFHRSRLKPRGGFADHSAG